MDDITEIYQYIRFLEKNFGLQITLHPWGYEPVITGSRLIRFNIHSNPYCLYLKNNPEFWKYCISRQQKVIAACEGGSICGTCFAGVREFVYPLILNDACKGFISVSGYRDENGESYVRRIAETYHFSFEELKRIYSELKETPPKEQIDAVMNPLCRMFELAYSKRKLASKREDLTMRFILHYLQINHTQPLTVDDICEHFHWSRSHLCHSFKKQTGQSITEYIKTLRIADAKNLLANTTMNITAIAVAVGFDNGNYFSTVFKKETGITPKEYRKKHQKKENLKPL